MNKIITITINGVVFNIEENAYKNLENYLKEIKEHLGSSENKDEIISDIEANICEKFSEKINTENQSITELDVNDLIKIMGTVEDFDKELKDESSKEEQKSPRKLYRNPDDEVIAGVCSGIAAYFGIDPVIIRLIFILSIFAGGTGIIVYLILCIIMPEAKTSSQKLEMYGNPVTLASIEKSVKSTTENIKKNKRVFKKIIELPFIIFKAVIMFIKKVLTVLWPITRISAGILITLCSLIVIGFLTFFTSIALFNYNSPYLISGIPIKEIVSIIPYHAFITSIYISILLPVILLLLAGISILRKKNIFNIIITSSIIGLWMIAMIATGTIAISFAPKVSDKINNYPPLQIKEKTYDFSKFTKIDSDGDYDIDIVKGDKFSILAKGRQQDLDSLSINSYKDTLTLKKEKVEQKNNICINCFNNNKIKITISAPDIDSAIINHSNIKLESFKNNKMELSFIDSYSDIDVNSKNLNILVDKRSKINLNGNFENITINTKDSNVESENLLSKIVTIVSDDSKINLKGSIAKLKITGKNDSKISSLNTENAETYLELSDRSIARISASKKLEGKMDITSKIYYINSPEIKIDGNKDLIIPIKETIKNEDESSIIMEYNGKKYELIKKDNKENEQEFEIRNEIERGFED